MKKSNGKNAIDIKPVSYDLLMINALSSTMDKPGEIQSTNLNITNLLQQFKCWDDPL